MVRSIMSNHASGFKTRFTPGLLRGRTPAAALLSPDYVNVGRRVARRTPVRTCVHIVSQGRIKKIMTLLKKEATSYSRV